MVDTMVMMTVAERDMKMVDLMALQKAGYSVNKMADWTAAKSVEMTAGK